jgi:hypothetical protein
MLQQRKEETKKIGFVLVFYSPLSDSIMSENTGIEPGTVALFALAFRRSSHSIRRGNEHFPF